MPLKRRELYSSPNGDRWFLARDPEIGELFVRHQANAPSGGHVTDIDIGAFLSGGQRNPEHQALLHLIGTLLESSPQPSKDESGTSETPRDQRGVRRSTR
jgi:hypothetical protein